jgi:hypothetical protein
MNTKASMLIFSLAALLPVGLFAQARELTPAEQKAADMRMPELDRSAMEPEKREPAKVLEGERNPFGLVALPPEEVEEIQTIQAETEEMRLRRILGNMRISGVSGTDGNYRVVLGSLHLRQGDTLPKLFANQAEVLRVSSITDREVVLSFSEKSADLPPRSIGLAYDLKPRPQSLLAGELFQKLVPFTAKGAPDLKPVEVPVVTAIGEAAEASQLQGYTERSFELMGEPSRRPAEEGPPDEAKD